MIELKKVSYGYDGGRLLSDISLSMTPGSFYFLTGPSGAGKTTLLKLCYLELRAISGKVEMFGRDTAGFSRTEIARTRRRIGVVHQDCRFLDHLSVAENILLPLSVSGQDTEAAKGDLDDLLNWVGLSDQAGARPPELSGGERQRAALARAVMIGPDIILADEPTGNIDWEMSQRLIRLLIELNRMGRAILLATHDLNLIRATKAEISARVLRLRDGELQAAGAEL